MYYAYIIQSLKDDSLYKGHTENLELRLNQHNKGRTKYTASRSPWKLIYFEEFQSREEAIKREKYFKSAAGRRFIKSLEL
jgi:putative endonuclease